MRTLAIETSCDETAIAVVEHIPPQPFPKKEAGGNSRFIIRANRTVSQIEKHRPYGGVFPALAKREHAKALVPLLVETLKEAGLYHKTSRYVLEYPLRDEFRHILEREPGLFADFVSVVTHIDPPGIDRIAVTSGPGLEPALWTGINFAKALAMIWKVPVIPVNHMEGHIFAAFLDDADATHFTLPEVSFPAIALLVSGGHTELVLLKNWLTYKVLGRTRDDAVGEAFDKVARLLGLPYPGGPEIARVALSGEAGTYPLPRPMLHSGDYDFSFAGLKTAVLYMTKKMGELSGKQKADIARAFEEACVDVLVTKTVRAAKAYDATTVLLGGGVSANERLRDALRRTLREHVPAATLYAPARAHATDNALMIAIAAALRADRPLPELFALNAEGNLRIDASFDATKTAQ